MRHIPEEELHAYLDQALSRSQCVEIETHLAECAHCRVTRDGIAALRDQTTLLLGALRPPRRVRPSYEALARRAEERSARRREHVRHGLWAASLIAALGLGYALRAELGVQTETPAVAQQPPAPSSDTAALTVMPSPAPVTASDPTPSRGASVASSSPVPQQPSSSSAKTPEPLAAELSTDALAPEDERLAGVWRTVPWSDVPNETGVPPARVAGLPVMQVQVQSNQNSSGGSILVVQQQLASGEVIRTIEGPAADVSKLLTRRGDDAVMDSAGRPAVTLQRGDRMIAVTGQIPPDSLQAMIRRVNAARRTRP